MTRIGSSAAGSGVGRGAHLEVPNPGQPGFDDSKPKNYVLEMLPYPSGEPHVGHLKNYALGDAIAHFRRRNGYQVIHPMGYDAFGFRPRTTRSTRAAPARRGRGLHRRLPRAVSRLGDLDRLVARARQPRAGVLPLDPVGLPAHVRARPRLPGRGAGAVVPVDQTVLANEQVIDGRCERCGSLVEARNLEQWFFAITEYADRLLADFDLLESWPEHVVTMQRNWIGRSEGAEVRFRCEELGIDFPVFTTRPDTLFGATFFVLAPEHPDVERLAAGAEHEAEVRAYVDESIRETAAERGSEERAKTGVPLGRTITNPVDGEQIPMFVADYVLMEYGTGALMAVPAHDHRDFEFATAFELPIRRVVVPRGEKGSDEPLGEPFLGHTDDEVLVNSGDYDGLCSVEAKRAIVADLEQRALGDPAVNYRLRDGCSSRQRYWGCPIPSSTATPTASSRCPTTSCRSSSPTSRTAPRPQPARDGGGLGQHDLSAVWRTRAPRDRHDGHLRRLVVVLPALPRPPQRPASVRSGRGRLLDAGRPVHRRRRARDPPPDVRALLHQGARRHGHAQRRGAFARLFTQGMSRSAAQRCPRRRATRSAPSTPWSAPAPTPPAPTSPSWGPPSAAATGSRRGTRRHRFLVRLGASSSRSPKRTERGDNAGVPAAGPARELAAKAHWAIDKVAHDMGTAPRCTPPSPR